MDGQTKRRHSIVRVVLELVEQSVVLVFLELKLAAMEIRRNINSAKTGAMILGLGGFLLLFSLLGVMATAIAALSLVLPVWLSALIVTAVLVFAGGGLLVTGLGKVKHFTIVPNETVERVENIAGKLKKHAELREHEAMEAREAVHEEAMARAAAHREAEHAREGLHREEARERARREAAELKSAVKREPAHGRELTYAKERAEAKEEREARRKTG